jgi:hypothetical protein
MRLLRLSTLFLAAHSCAEVAVHTVDEVVSQVSRYLELIENGIITTRSQLPTSCTLAVRILFTASC